MRRVVIEHIPTEPDAAIDSFLTDVLNGDADAGIRSLAAKALGAHGTDQCLPALAKAAATDQVTEIQMGCIVGKGTARRTATFAIAELATRYPKLADNAAEALREADSKWVAPRLRDLDSPKFAERDGAARDLELAGERAVPYLEKLLANNPSIEARDPAERLLAKIRGPVNESLADARVQALYQVTSDEKLLVPFLERLRSKDVKVRENGAVAFQFFKLKVAPPELVSALDDADAGVRLWAGLVLGEIGDPKTVPVLMEMAGDTKKDTGLRCNVIGSLGRMKAAAATDQMRKLLADKSEVVQVQAAIALYRLTGEKVKQYPSGYKAD